MCRELGVPTSHFYSRDRTTEVAEVRTVCVGLLREHCDPRVKWKDITAALGRRHNSTARDAYRRWLELPQSKRDEWFGKMDRKDEMAAADTRFLAPDPKYAHFKNRVIHRVFESWSDYSQQVEHWKRNRNIRDRLRDEDERENREPVERQEGRRHENVRAGC